MKIRYLLLSLIFICGGYPWTGYSEERNSPSLQESLCNLLCQSHLHQIYETIQQYAKDHKGRLPDANNQSVRPWLWWDQDLHAYVPDLRIFYCPTATPQYFPLLVRAESTTLHLKSGEKLNGIPLDVQAGNLLLAIGESYDTLRFIPLTHLMESDADHWRVLAQGDRSPLLPVKWERRDIGYGMNYRFGSPYAEISNYRLDQMIHPEKVILIGDSHAPVLRSTKTMWKKDAAPRHAGHANFLFADGHVESIDPKPNAYSHPNASGILDPSHWLPEFAP